ncbi:peptidyl-tRNA hydrolase [Helicobacter aurati]|uniref:Peptidyl-tRNA hydrolase n=1 Tax=Helicobacter aurati TaxID=137778 RepID=A0A3D8J376_9HELI|nr:aminoacyl-tRNA hydrolase [Helicobacter aurati]RDU71977.1 peptidyl-tRNA hydrolase [Helicobacter aurati]
MQKTILIVGLGNVTDKYIETRHNIGFLCLESLYNILNQRQQYNNKWLGIEKIAALHSHKITYRINKKLDSIVAKIPLKEFITPLQESPQMLQNFQSKQYHEKTMQQNFENLCKTKAIDSYQVILAAPITFMNNSGNAVKKIQDFYDVVATIVIYDDLDTRFGAVNFRTKGGDAGHNGLKSIHKCCGKEYLRVKLGIGANLFVNQMAFIATQKKNPLLNFATLNQSYRDVLLQRLHNNKQFKTQTFFRILKQHLLDSIESNKLQQESQITLNQEIDKLFKDFVSLHKTMQQEIPRYVLSDFNVLEQSLLHSLLYYTSLSVIRIVFDKIFLDKSVIDSFSINYK